MAKSYPQIVLFGDSLLQNSADVQDGFSFQGALLGKCIRRFDVVNRGFSGYSTKNALSVLPDVFLPRSESTPKIDYLIILLGANDAAIPLPNNTQHVPIETYRENLKTIITHERIQAHKPKILLVTPPPLDEIRCTELSLAQGYREATRQAAVSASYSEMARKVASELDGVELIDLQKAIMEKAIEQTPGFDPTKGPSLGYPGGQRGALEQLMPDGLHMSGAAYRVFYDIIEDHIGPIPTTADGYVFPTWREMNPGSM